MKAVLTIECETIEELRHVIASLPPLPTELVAINEVTEKIEEVKLPAAEHKPSAEKVAEVKKYEKKEVYTRVCQNPKCGETFQTGRADKLFCSSKCYQAEWQRKKKLTESR